MKSRIYEGIISYLIEPQACWKLELSFVMNIALFNNFWHDILQ